MTEIPEHLLKRAKEARDKNAKKENVAGEKQPKTTGKHEIRKEWLFGALILVEKEIALIAVSLGYGFIWDDESVHFKADMQHVFWPQSWSDWLSAWKTHQG